MSQKPTDGNVTTFPTPVEDVDTTRTYTITYDGGGLGEPLFMTVTGHLAINAMLVSVLEHSDPETAGILFTMPMSRLIAIKQDESAGLI